MKAVVKQKSGEGHVGLEEVEEPACGPEEVKVAVRFCGICGTDLHVMHDTFPNYPPVILGHEFSGTVAEVGEKVGGIEAGDRVAVLPSSAVTCGTCIHCRTGRYMFCTKRRGMGHGVDGAMTSYAVVRADQVYKLPDDLTLEKAALSEPFASAVQAVTEFGGLQAGDVALVSGPGPIGLLCLQLLVASGVKTIVAGLSEDRMRLEAAEQIGASTTVDVETQDLQAVIDEETRGTGVEAAFETAGAEASVQNSLEAVKALGRHIQVGIAGRPINVDFDTILHKQLQVYGSVGHSVETWNRVMRIHRQETIQIDDLITHTLPLAEWQQGFDLCQRKQGIKVLMTPNGTAGA